MNDDVCDARASKHMHTDTHSDTAAESKSFPLERQTSQAVAPRLEPHSIRHNKAFHMIFTLVFTKY